MRSNTLAAWAQPFFQRIGKGTGKNHIGVIKRIAIIHGMMRFSIRRMGNLIERQLRIIDKRLLERGKRIVYTAILLLEFAPRDFLQRPMRGMLILIDKFAVYHAVFQEFPGINKIGTGFLGQTRRCALRSCQCIPAGMQLLIFGK